MADERPSLTEDQLRQRDEEIPLGVHLGRIARELTSIRVLVAEGISDMRKAESEIPESMRRFMNYMHDVHDVKYMYEELGHPVPQHIHRELERLDDRYRQLLAILNLDTEAFGKVRAEMARDSANRWDHTVALPKPTHLQEPNNEARNGTEQ